MGAKHSFLSIGGTAAFDCPKPRMDYEGELVVIDGFGPTSQVWLTQTHAEQLANDIIALLQDVALASVVD